MFPFSNRCNCMQKGSCDNLYLICTFLSNESLRICFANTSNSCCIPRLLQSGSWSDKTQWRWRGSNMHERSVVQDTSKWSNTWSPWLNVLSTDSCMTATDFCYCRRTFTLLLSLSSLENTCSSHLTRLCFLEFSSILEGQRAHKPPFEVHSLDVARDI